MPPSPAIPLVVPPVSRLPTLLATAFEHLPDESATAQLGARLASAIRREDAAIRQHGLTIALSGDLGAGKTALVRAVLRSLGETGPVKSPTYALLEPYVVSSLDFHHFDFYRVKESAEFDTAGFRELFGPGRVCAVEWPERATSRLPTPDLLIALRVEEEMLDGATSVPRLAKLSAYSDLGARCLSQMITESSGGA